MYILIYALDCTHIRTQSPDSNIGETFRNRKGYFSLNVQAVGGANLKILDLEARWPGSVHDQTIFDASFLKVVSLQCKIWLDLKLFFCICRLKLNGEILAGVFYLVMVDMH